MPVAQEIVDQQTVDRTLLEIQSSANSPADQQWAAAYQAKANSIRGLLEEYVPEARPIDIGIISLLGASMLNYAGEKYGHDETKPKLYSGSVEQRVIATYHHAGHPESVLRDMLRYARARNMRYPGTFTMADKLRFPFMALPHDAIMGNGRMHDERQSGQLASTFMMMAGITLLPDEQTQVTIEASGWNAAKRQQAFDKSKGHFTTQQGLCVSDLMPLCDERGPYQAVCLAPEDFSKQRYGRMLSKAAKAAGISLSGASVDTCMQLIDERLPNEYGQFLSDQVGFFGSYQPADPEVDSYFPGREAGTAFMAQMHKDYSSQRPGRLTAAGSLLRAREYMYDNAA